MQKARRHPIQGLRPLVGVRFQVLFTSLFGILFTFPSQYQFTIGLSVVFSLTRWCWQIHARFLRSRATQDTLRKKQFTNTGLSPSVVHLSMCFLLAVFSLCGSYNPYVAVTTQVWALPRSLATTWGIIKLFSFPPLTQMFQFSGLTLKSVKTLGLPHSEISGSKVFRHLSGTYRSCTRPSSSLKAQASAVRPL